MAKFPNLFVLQRKDAERLYSSYLSVLLRKSGAAHRVIEACRRIRALAVRCKQPRLGDFTYSFEIDALCNLRDFSAAWRVLRRAEHIAFRRKINLEACKWTSSELDWFAQYHPQILYFKQKYELARRLYEAVLSEMLAPKRKGLSYELLGYVYNSLARPRRRQEVTLYHVYRALEKSLTEWKGWEQFVTGFDARLFQLSGIDPTDLLHDPALLHSFSEAINREREARLTAGVTTGETELVDPPDKVRKYQENVIKKRASQQATYAAMEQRLQELFPELRLL